MKNNILLLGFTGITAYYFGAWQDSLNAGLFAFNLGMMIFSTTVVVRK